MDTTLTKMARKGIILLVAMCLLSLAGRSQLVIQSQLPPGGMLQKNQLWNLSVLNNYNRTMDVQIQLLLSDATGSVQKIKASSRTVTLKPGINLLNFLQLSPITYQQQAAEFTAARLGLVPVGQFLACYSITAFRGDASEVVGEECIPVTAEPLSPPMLNLPADEDSLDTRQPGFSWLPPAPLHLFQQLSYDFVLVKVLPGQGRADAIQKNRPVYSVSSYNGTQLQFPSSYPALDTSASYAWQVAARNGKQVVTRSEVWTFAFNSKKSIEAEDGHYYHELNRTQDGSFAVCSESIRFAYQNERNDSLIHISITDITKEKKQPVEIPQEEWTVSFGQNYLSIDIRDLAALKPGHFYLLEVSNADNAKQYLKFRYQSPK